GSGARRERARHPLDAVDEAAAQQLRLACLDIGDDAHHLPEDGVELYAGQRYAEAVVRATSTEAKVAVGAARDVELPRALERALVAVARVVEEDHLLPRRERLAVQLDLARGGAAEGEHGRGPAHELLHRVR